jgi:hypothetical protein
MTWLKVDDKLHDHRKARKAGTAAMGLWVLAGSWCAANPTDGFVPEAIVVRWSTKAMAGRLVDAQLWHPAEQDGEAGWQFHDWHEYQPSAADVARNREKKGHAGSEGNHRRWHVRRGIVSDECDWCLGVAS